MKLRILFSLCCLAALAALSSQAFADAFCADPPPYQYQNCGVEAPSNAFTVNSTGLVTGITMLFGGYHADFSSSMSALVWRNGQLVYQGSDSLLNTQMATYQYFNLVPKNELEAGDQIEFVLTVNDPNGVQKYYSSELDKNSDGMNHLWAESLSNGQCMVTAGQCAYIGFEDLPVQEGSDFDYNDFKAWIFGANISTPSQGQDSPVPEPSSILLLTGAPLAFVLKRFRRFL